MPGIFISYRRSDSAGYAGRLFDRLVEHFGEDRVFMDVDTLPPGADFRTHIKRFLTNADVALVLIGPNWAEDAARPGTADFVQLELELAEEFAQQVIPVTLNATALPSGPALPAHVQTLVGRQAFQLRHAGFGGDVDVLIAALAKTVAPSPTGRRGQVSSALRQAGAPASWLAPLAARGGLRWGLAGALAVLGVAWVASLWVLGAQAHRAGFEAGNLAANADWAGEARKASDRSLVLRGRVKNAANEDIEGATIRLSNPDVNKTIEVTTNSNGDFQADLRKIEVSDDTLIGLVVAKATYRSYTDSFRYAQGFDYRSVLQPAGGPGVQ